ncbi:metallophosphoesterase [Arcobacter sp. YIC-464]|uniref:metallophosphoesterase n=1 Tax=Arcobacter sp. YIC-464 TaxID=3376631 RepID=UPI003C222572
MKINDINSLNILVNKSSLNKFKILHISDLHINKKTDILSIKKLINLCETIDYDILVITGDIIDCKAIAIKDKLELLNSLKNAYYISGNHDLFYGLKDLKDILNEIIFLDNKIEFLEFNNEKIALAGLSDRFSKFFRIKRNEKSLLDLLVKCENRILLAHQPKDYTYAVKNNVDVFLCGHTHGGQIYPFHYVVKLVQPFLSGLHYINKTAIYVNKGIGTWGIDFRYKANSEITLLNLVYN